MVRAIRGPVVLITLGVLFALNNFTPYSFSETWPVLLIVVGLFSLLGRGPAQRPYQGGPGMPPPPPPHGPGAPPPFTGGPR